jgi:glycosyltransferase involved in cell wall biosynthesis
VLLFFGNVAPYKGLEYLVQSMESVRKRDGCFRLIIAGQIKGCAEYWKEVDGMIKKLHLDECVLKRITYIPDEEVEVFFRSADVLVLPYRFIYQSGVLFLAYSFGLPVIATDVGSLREDIIEGKTGFVCRADDPADMAEKIRGYFESDLFRNLESNRKEIIKWAKGRYSWDEVAERSYRIYNGLL